VRPLAAAGLAAVLLCGIAVQAAREYQVTGMVLEVNERDRTIFVSHDRIPGLMDAMAMPFPLARTESLTGVVRGAIVTFTLVVEEKTSYARGVRIQRYESVQQDPLNARRLALLDRITRGGRAGGEVAVGDLVPDFALTDQVRHRVTRAAIGGRVAAINFVYTSCALPQFCYLMTSHFNALNKRFARELSRGDLTLLTVTFDPARDTPEVLAKYAAQWGADASRWHFLTGEVDEVQRFARSFGIAFFPNEGLMDHSLRTVIVDRAGRVSASIEGNQFTPRQLGDLVERALRR
jgi:protein SCO1/2